MLGPVPPDAIGRGEYREEVSIELLSATAGPAHAGQRRLSFQVDPPVGSLAVFWREHLHQVIIDRLVGAGGLGKAAAASRKGHVIGLSAPQSWVIDARLARTAPPSRPCRPRARASRAGPRSRRTATSARRLG